MSRAIAAVRFRRGLGELTGSPAPTLDQARERLRRARAGRDASFLASLDRLVLANPSSPYSTLLRWAGIERGDIIALLESEGLEASLLRLRDAGVYVSHEEWLGLEPVRRGSSEARFGPADFANPLAPGDMFAGTGGTRSGGVPVSWSFRALRGGADAYALRARTWRVDRTPSAIWLPGQPSGVGLASALLLYAAEGVTPERWFSPIGRDRRSRDDRIADRGLKLLARSRGIRLPHLSTARLADPWPVLRWCEDALRRSPRARLGAYTGSAVALAEAAIGAGVSLRGLVIATLGEPLDQGRADAIAASGAEAANGYGFMQKGTVAHGCPALEPGKLHLLEHRVAVIQRAREIAGGGRVGAFLWTSLHQLTPTVMLNTENDDFGLLPEARDCDCELGRIGFRRRIADVRGISKVSAEGMTVRGETFARLAHGVLPDALGGGPSDYQFEQRPEGSRSTIVLRIDPRIGEIDAGSVRRLCALELERTGPGRLAAAVWDQSGGIHIDRSPPRTEASGKLLPLTIA